MAVRTFTMSTYKKSLAMCRLLYMEAYYTELTYAKPTCTYSN